MHKHPRLLSGGVGSEHGALSTFWSGVCSSAQLWSWVPYRWSTPVDSETPVYPSGRGLGQQLLLVSSAARSVSCEWYWVWELHPEELTKPALWMGPVITGFAWSHIPSFLCCLWGCSPVMMAKSSCQTLHGHKTKEICCLAFTGNSQREPHSNCFSKSAS